MVSHICLLVELGPICNSMAASLCLKSCEDHSLLKSYNGGLWKNIYRSGPCSEYPFCHTKGCDSRKADMKKPLLEKISIYAGQIFHHKKQ